MAILPSSIAGIGFKALQSDVVRGQRQCVLGDADKHSVREMVVAMVAGREFRRLGVPSAQDVQILIDSHSNAATVFTDIVLVGRINGPELVTQDFMRKPNMRVVFR